jgi:hypothetical protein
MFMKFAGLLLLVTCLSSLAMGAAVAAPEISPATGVGALALLSGAILVIRGRRKR